MGVVGTMVVSCIFALGELAVGFFVPDMLARMVLLGLLLALYLTTLIVSE